jgi:3-phenylpropionate/cinnamic acid dioxygenase small subunit
MVDRSDIENFLYLEARLLDTCRFEDWLDLFTEDAIYWVPAGGDDIEPNEHVSIIYDDKAHIAKRIKRLRSGFAYAQDPLSRVHRLISNVEIVEPRNPAGELNVRCMMLLIELARHRQTIHSARCEFQLIAHNKSWRIRQKKVNLLRNNEPLENTPFLI